MSYDVVVIGGGAAGIVAAGRAAQGGAKVLLLERNRSLGKKLLITGKGRCNITNIGEIADFIENYGKNGKFLYRAFSEFFNQDLISFFERYGVETKVERGGRVFPATDNSQTVLTALQKYLADNGAAVRYDSRVAEIVVSERTGSDKKNTKLEVKGIKLKGGDIVESGRVVLATGGLSYPLTGSSGDGYEMAHRLGHTIAPLRPALVPLETKRNFVKELQGLSLKNVEASILVNKKKVASEFGEMLFTHFGISGPIILKLSGLVCEYLESGAEVLISINFKPALDQGTLTGRLLREFKASGRKALSTVIKNLLPQKLAPIFVELAGIEGNKKCSQVTAAERNRILELLTDFRLQVKKPRPIDEAIVTRGGIALDEIDPRTMESKKVKGLFFCGEIVDIDGATGGYNLQAAFSTGFLAGENAGGLL